MAVFITGKDPLQSSGGLETYVRAHALAASQAGLDVDVFCIARRSSERPTDWGRLQAVGTPVRPIASFMAPLHGVFVRRAVIRHAWRFGSRGPVIVHGFGPWSMVAVAVSRALGRAGIESVPVASAYTTLLHEQRGMLGGVRRAHGVYNLARYAVRYLWVRALVDRLERRGYRRSRLVLLNYESVRTLLLGSCGPDLAVRRIPYASELAFDDLMPAPPVPAPIARLKPEDAPLILSVSRHDPRKGVDVLLRALARLAEADIPFRACLVGPGATLGVDRELSAQLGLQDQVAIPGRVLDVGTYYRHADVFVLPSLEEGSGSLSLLEALQSGLPIVATRCDGIPEDVHLGGEGTGVDAGTSSQAAAAVLVEPANEQALTDALGRVLADSSLRSRLGSQARAIYEQRFSAEVFVDALRDTYAELGVSAAA